MARNAVCCCLASLLFAAVLSPAAAGLGHKAKGLAGKGGDVNVDVQCQQACKEVCVPVPNKVCTDVPYETQACRKVPVQMTKQKCERVCTQTYTETVAAPIGKGAPVLPVGKGGMYGRRLTGISKKKPVALVAPMSYGKGGPQLLGSNCQDVCHDVPYTVMETACETITKTKKLCDIVYQQQCQQVCKPVCQKVTTVTTVTQMGKGAPVVPVSKGKGLGKL